MKKKIITLIVLMVCAIGMKARTWDFTVISDDLWTQITEDATNWSHNSDTRYYYAAKTSKNSLKLGDGAFEYTAGLKFTAGAGKIGVEKNNRIQLNGNGIAMIITGLKKGQTVTLTCMTANVSDPRGFDVSNLTPVSGHFNSITTERQVNIGEVTADGDVTMTTTGGMSVYKIEVSETAPQLAKPEITVAEDGTVTISQADGAEVYYTTNNTVPSAENGTKYQEPFKVEDGTTVKAIAIGDGVTAGNSDVVEKQVLLAVAIETPVIKAYNGTVAISCTTPNVTIEYSVDGGGFNPYTRTFTLTEDAVVNVRASREGSESASAVAEVKAVPANGKTKTIYMGWGSFTLTKSDKESQYSTLVGAEGDDAEGYSLILTNIEKDWSNDGSGSKIVCPAGGRTGIKVSNGAQNILRLPEGVKATRLTLYSYVNKSGEIRTSGWKEIGGEEIPYADVPMSMLGDNDDRFANPDVRIFPLDNAEGDITFTNTGEQVCFVIGLDVIEAPVEVSVGAAGIATYSSDKALDFSGSTEIEAYTASSYTGATVNMTKVAGSVPAGTGLILKSVGGGETTARIPVVENADAVEGNLLVAMVEAGNIEASAEGSYNYIFGKGDLGTGFYKLNSTFESAANKAYLHTDADLLAASAAKGVVLDFGNSTTGIDEVNANEKADTGIYYNLKGMKVGKPQKGLYILNGKKVIVK